MRNRRRGRAESATKGAGQRGGKVITLDDDDARFQAEADPAGFVAQNLGALLAIAEVQRVPRLNLALKAAVDADGTPGRFLLTGSANLLQLSGTEDSLAGRLNRDRTECHQPCL